MNKDEQYGPSKGPLNPPLMWQAEHLAISPTLEPGVLQRPSDSPFTATQELPVHLALKIQNMRARPMSPPLEAHITRTIRVVKAIKDNSSSCLWIHLVLMILGMLRCFHCCSNLSYFWLTCHTILWENFSWGKWPINYDNIPSTSLSRRHISMFNGGKWEVVWTPKTIIYLSPKWLGLYRDKSSN